MFTQKNLRNSIVALIIGIVFAGIVYMKDKEKSYDVNNEISVLSRNNPQNTIKNENQFYRIQPADIHDFSSPSKKAVNYRKEVIPKNSNTKKCKFVNNVPAMRTLFVAAQLNKSQVSIMIIRRELTDFENVIVVTEIMLIDNGGLPLGALSNLEQFFDGTYFPPLYFSNPRKTKAPNGFLTVSAR